MRLQKHKTRKTDSKEYSKYVVIIPQEHIEELGWEEGQELEPKVRGRKLLISPKESEED
jgi:bifunctional DNA-binding transcriptional regulator/antitoxin component of YhaV-PrlF toxin-antitoxin module